MVTRMLSYEDTIAAIVAAPPFPLDPVVDEDVAWYGSRTDAGEDIWHLVSSCFRLVSSPAPGPSVRSKIVEPPGAKCVACGSSTSETRPGKYLNRVRLFAEALERADTMIASLRSAVGVDLAGRAGAAAWLLNEAERFDAGPELRGAGSELLEVRRGRLRDARDALERDGEDIIARFAGIRSWSSRTHLPGEQALIGEVEALVLGEAARTCAALRSIIAQGVGNGIELFGPCVDALCRAGAGPEVAAVVARSWWDLAEAHLVLVADVWDRQVLYVPPRPSTLFRLDLGRREQVAVAGACWFYVPDGRPAMVSVPSSTAKMLAESPAAKSLLKQGLPVIAGPAHVDDTAELYATAAGLAASGSAPADALDYARLVLERR